MSGEIVVPETPNWLKDLEEKREKRIKARLGHEAGAGAPCLKCGTDCPGLDLHFWRKACKICRCPKEEHDVHDDDIYGWAQFQLLGSKPNKIKTKIVLPGKNDEVELEWAPKGQKDTVDKYLKTLAPENLPVKGSQAAQNRKQLLQKQIPIHDIDPSLCHELNEDEVSKMEEYIAHIKNSSVGVGQLVNLSNIIRGNLHNISPEEAHIIAAKYSKGVPINEIVKLQSDLAHTLEKIAINSPKGLRQMQPTKPFVNTEENVVNVTPSSKYKDITHPWYANSSPNSRLLNSQCAENLTQNNRTPSNYEIDERLLKGTNFNPSLTPGQFISNRPTVNANRPLENQNIGQPSFSQHLKENKTQQYGFENPYFNRKPVMQNLEQLQNYKIQDESQEQETPKNVKDLIYSTYDIRQGPVQKDLELEHKNLVNTLPNFDSNILPNTYKHDPSVIQHEHRLGITNEKSQNYDPVTEKSLVGDFGFESPSMNLSGNNRKPLTSFSPNNLHINEESVNPQQLNIGGIRDLKPDPGNVKLTGSNRKPLSSFTPNRFNVNEESVNPQQMNIGSIKDQTPDSLNKGLSGRNRKPLTSLTPNRFRINEESLNPQQINIGAIQDLEPDIYSGDDLAAYVQDESQSDKSYPPETINEILNNINLPDCHYCKKPFEENEFAVTIDRANALFHAHCFKCAGCNQSLADNIYFYDKESNNIYCGRDYAKIRGYPRCSACDELIFTKEYCLAENSTFHLKHFCCIQCDTPLAGQEYTLEDEKPYCLPCFESTKAAKCGTCEKVIKPDERGCQLNGVHFHAEDDCFRCIVCSLPLMGKKLLLRNEKLYCSHECFNSVKM
ncbi:hypothetical protein ABEB36_007529 [Hypothenemus hampei]|uniref:Testin n=1 Tax=Hypothenemus hampei TaxID=57062 RepID=A0ABD1EUB7_HYPHA